ncbi:MAG: hypothetical protein CL607_03435 [Anaerolineaceae bacterium]|nr:hypothetical protein [Anaerolineaceae bacterium]
MFPKALKRSDIASHINEMYPQLLLVIFFSGTMRGFSAPYFNLYLDAQDFSGTLIGIVLSIAALVELVGIPMLSNLADRTNRHRTMYRGIVLAYISAIFLMLAFPITAVLFAGMIVAQVCFRSTFIFVIQLAFTKLEQVGKSNFGRVRSISASGFVVGNLISGLIFSIAQFTGLFLAAIASGLAVIGLSNALPINTSDKPTDDINNTQATSRRQLYPVFVAQFFAMMGLRTGFAFWLLHFQENLGIATEQITLIVVVSSLMEIPWYNILDGPLRKHSAVWFYIAGALGFGVIWVLIGSATSLLWVMAIMVLRGPMFAMVNLSMLVHVNKVSHPRNVSTNQALIQITIPSLAALLASAPLGYVYDNAEPIIFFSICAALMVMGGGILLVSQLVSRKRKRFA